MPTSSDERALIACAFWLHVGLVFTTTTVAGVLLWLAGEVGVASALVIAILGIVLGAASWRRAREALERSPPRTRQSAPTNDMRRARDGYTTP